MILGYARVSTVDQDTAAQLAALQAGGAERVYHEQASGGRFDRPVLQQLLEQLRPGDVLLVWKLDRLSRSLRDLLKILDRIELAGAGFRSVTEQIDTQTAAGRMMMQMLGAFAEFERAMIQERTRAGLRQAAANGRHGGRPPALTKSQKDSVLELLRNGRSQAEVAQLFSVSPSTISRLAHSI